MTTVGAGSTTSPEVEAVCPSSHPYLVGGGGAIGGGTSASTFLEASFPTNVNGVAYSNAWVVEAGGAPINGTAISAYAICAK